MFIDGEAVYFPNAKAKELLALCVDHRGGAVTIEEAVDKLWENRAYDDRVKNLYRKAVMQIRQVLAEHGAEALFSGSRGACQIDVRQMDCDYYEFLQGNRDALRAWQISGSYLEEYSWRRRPQRDWRILRKKCRDSGRETVDILKFLQ